MHITDYFNQMQVDLDRVTAISSRNITFDQRSDVVGYVRGVIDFTDGSQLHFSEYVNVERGPNRLKYSYHFMRKHQLLFRYDNASDPKATALKTYPHHKHHYPKSIHPPVGFSCEFLDALREFVWPFEMRQ